MANFYKKSHQLGRSMIEMLGVLAIIGVLSVGGIAGYTKAMEAYRINKLRDQIAIIIQNLATAVANGQDTIQLDNTDVIDALQILPPEMGSAGNCHHALGGRCRVTSTGNGVNNYGITLRLQDLPPKACVEIAISDISIKSRRAAIYINSTNRYEIDASTCVNEDGTETCKFARGARTPAQAAKECSGKLNAIVYVFGSRF